MTTHTTTKSTVADKPRAVVQDAIALLKADHKTVSGLFAGYEAARSATAKKDIVAEICTARSVHTQIEEEIFYPDAKAALKDRLLVPEATVEHGGVKSLLAQLNSRSCIGIKFKVHEILGYVSEVVRGLRDTRIIPAFARFRCVSDHLRAVPCPCWFVSIT